MKNRVYVKLMVMVLLVVVSGSFLAACDGKSDKKNRSHQTESHQKVDQPETKSKKVDLVEQWRKSEKKRY